MDVYLSEEASLLLKALSLASSRPRADGFLIGHKRGQRFFVEKIFSSERGFFPSLENFRGLDQLFDGKIIGFFSFKADKKKIKKILAAFAYGKLFLDVHLNKRHKMAIRSYVVDFRNTFYLSPVIFRLCKSNITKKG